MLICWVGSYYLVVKNCTLSVSSLVMSVYTLHTPGAKSAERSKETGSGDFLLYAQLVASAWPRI